VLWRKRRLGAAGAGTGTGPNSTSASGNHAAIVSPSSERKTGDDVRMHVIHQIEDQSRLEIACTCSCERASSRNIFNPLRR
jgi:hypothetical protein